MRYRYAPFLTWLVIAALAFGIGGWIRGCQMSSRTDLIGHQKEAQADKAGDILMIAQLEGRAPGTPLHAIAGQIRIIAADPKYAGPKLGEILALAAQVKSLDGAQLDRLGSLDRWMPFKTLAHLPHFDAVASLANRYDLNEAVFGGRDLSTRIAPPSEVPPSLAFFGSLGLWLVVYLIACGAFVLLWSIGIIIDEADPVRTIRWKHPLPQLTVLMTAPASVPALALYGLGWVIYRFCRDGERMVDGARAGLGRFGRTCMRIGYRLRLLRRLPAPALAPLPVPADRSARAEEVTPSGPRRVSDDHAWIVVDPRVTLGRKHRLEARGIRVYPIALHVPESFEGQAVPEPQIAEFEDELGLKDVGREDEATDVERVTYRDYDYGNGEVTIIDLRKEDLREALEEALEEASAEDDAAEIRFYDVGGRMRDPRADAEGWTVLSYSVPEGPGTFQYHDRLYGVALDISLRCFAPSARGAVLRDPDGLAVAQIVGRNIYILVDLPYVGGLPGKEAFMQECLVRILTEAFKVREADAGLSDERLRQLLEGGMDEHRKRYVGICLRRVETQKEEIQAGIAACDTLAREAGVSITRHLLERKKLAGRLVALEAGEWREEFERLGREFDALAASKVVTSARAYDDRVEVETTTVHIRHGGNTYLIGRFRLILHADGRIDIRNIENHRKSGDAHHPHVTHYACLGNIAEALGKYMAEREYAAVVALLHRYLGSYNPQSPLSKIENWPIVKERA